MCFIIRPPLVGTDLGELFWLCPSGIGSSVITQCCIHELYLQGKSHQPAVDLAKSFERRKCNHKEAIPGDECIAAVVGEFVHCVFPVLSLTTSGESNKHRYVIATQSHPLRVSLRAVPGVPIVHVNRTVMILEPASDATLRAKHLVRHANPFARNPSFTYRCNLQAEQDALAPSTSEKAKLNAAAPQVEHVPKKKRGPKGPNPLSVKKKAQKHGVEEPKKASTTRGDQVDERGKRKRDESDNDGEASSPRPKRRRRRKSQARP